VPAAGIGNIVAGSDGNLWFIKEQTHPWVITRVTSAGQMTDFAIPAPNDLSASLWDLTAGSDGNVWFADALWIGKITPAGETTLYALPDGMNAMKLTYGPDGNIWFVDPIQNKIGRMTPDGQATEFGGVTNVRVDSCSSVETFIAPGLNGTVWFTEPLVAKYGIIDHAGQVTENALPDAGEYLGSWTIGRDGNLWSNNAVDAFVRFSPDGSMTEFAHPINRGGAGFHVGSDGRMWYVGGSGFGAVNTDGTYTEYWTDGAALWEGGIKGFTTGPNNTLWFTYTGYGAQTSQVVRVDLDQVQPITATFNQTLTVNPGASEVVVRAAVHQANLYTTDQAVQPLIDWGDGTPPQPGEFSSASSLGVGAPPTQVGMVQVGGVHTYAHEGTYVINFTFNLVPFDQLQIQPRDQTGVIPLTTIPTSAVISYPPHEKLVMRLYEDLLHRQADGAGLAGWTALLDQGMSTADVARLMESTPEYRTKAVDRLYEKLLDREPDSGGLAAGLNFLAAGGTPEQIRASILSSAEYLAGHGHGTVDGFLYALYQDVLGRSIDPVGLQNWQAALAGGVSPAAVIDGVASSGEGLGHEIDLAYAQTLHRQADVAGEAAWETYLQAMHSSDELLVGLVSSDEYFQSARAQRR
jgi:streptogramin lyase